MIPITQSSSTYLIRGRVALASSRCSPACVLCRGKLYQFVGFAFPPCACTVLLALKLSMRCCLHRSSGLSEGLHNFPECSDLSLARRRVCHCASGHRTGGNVRIGSSIPITFHRFVRCHCVRSKCLCQPLVVGWRSTVFLCCAVVAVARGAKESTAAMERDQAAHRARKRSIAARRNPCAHPMDLDTFHCNCTAAARAVRITTARGLGPPLSTPIARVASLFGRPLPSALLTTP